jgi:hypothetical protein
MPAARNFLSAAVWLSCLLSRAASAQTCTFDNTNCTTVAKCPVNANCPTAKDPSIPYCSYYDRFQLGVADYKVGCDMNGTISSDLNTNFNDYGSLFEDMSRGGCCPETVERLLSQKIDAELAGGGFTGQWLGGGDIYLIATTALQLGARGSLPAGLDNRVMNAICSYVKSNTPDFFKRCGWPTDTCMDDYSVGAAGFAWAAAYLQLSGRGGGFTCPSGLAISADSLAWRAKDFFQRSFSQTESVCLHKANPDGTLIPSCSACEPVVTAAGVDQLKADIRSNKIVVATFNHLIDNPNYGAGLFTSLAIAAAGLTAAGRPYSTNDPVENVIAQGLFRHAQQHLNNTSTPATALYTPFDGFAATDIGWDYTMGYGFTPNKTITVTALGGFFNGTKTVYLYNRSTLAVLASAGATAANGWGYASIAPVTLTAGTPYSVGVYLAGSGGAYRYSLRSMPSVVADASIDGTCYRFSSTAEPCSYSGVISGVDYGMADIQYTTASTDPCQPWGGNCSFIGDTCQPTKGCEEDINYAPGMYPVKSFLQKFYATDLILPSGFQFDAFCPTFVDDQHPNQRTRFHACEGFFGDGRRAAYRDLTRWIDNPPLLMGPQWTPADVEPPRLWADVPSYMQVINDPTDFFGWAIDRESAIVSVKFYVDGIQVQLQGYNYGGARTDVCSTLGLSKCPYCPSGWGGKFDPSALANGTHTLHITATDVSGKTAPFDTTFVVNRPQAWACSANPPVGSYNINAYYAGYYDYQCGYNKYTYGYDPYGYCNLAASYASSARVNTAATGTCAAGTSYNYYAGLYDYYCRYYEYINYGWDYGSYCYWANYYASVGGCSSCSP